MTVRTLTDVLGLDILVEGDPDRQVTGGYCGDLLSWVMGRAKAGDAWMTVMGNVNAMAVALLADVACVVLAEGAQFDDEAKQKAEQNDIAVLASPRPVYDTAREIDRELHP